MSDLGDTLSWLSALMALGWHFRVESRPTATLQGMHSMASNALGPQMLQPVLSQLLRFYHSFSIQEECV